MKVRAIEDQPIAALQLSATLHSLCHEVELVDDGATVVRQLQQLEVNSPLQPGQR